MQLIFMQLNTAESKAHSTQDVDLFMSGEWMCVVMCVFSIDLGTVN